MPIVGVTGGFGTGKSYVASIFRRLGAKVVDADKLAHTTLKKGSAVYGKIVAAFGKKVLKPNLSIDRRVLGHLVFGNKRRLTRLNNIIHPEVIKNIKKKIRALPENEVLVIDAPLICETNIAGLMNVMIVVKSSRERQVNRCVKKFKMEKKDVCKRIACQMPLAVKAHGADYVVNNDGTRKETEKQVKKIWQDIKKGAGLWR